MSLLCAGASGLGVERGKGEGEPDPDQVRVVTDCDAVGGVDGPPPGVDGSRVGAGSEQSRRDRPEAVAAAHHVRREDGSRRRGRDRGGWSRGRERGDATTGAVGRGAGSGRSAVIGGTSTTGPVGAVDGGASCAATASGVATATRVVVVVDGSTSRSQPRTLSAAPAGRGPMNVEPSASSDTMTARTPIGTVRSRSARTRPARWCRRSSSATRPSARRSRAATTAPSAARPMRSPSVPSWDS